MANSNNAAVRFYNSLNEINGFHTGFSAQELRQRNMEPSHTIMNGVEYTRGHMLHNGSLYAPSDKDGARQFATIYSQAINIGADLYISENRTLHFPLFFDIDCRLENETPTLNMLMALAAEAKIPLPKVVHDELENIMIANEIARANGINDKHNSNNSNNSNNNLEVTETIDLQAATTRLIDDDDDNSERMSLENAVPALTPVQFAWLMDAGLDGLAVIIQRELITFFPDAKPTDALFTAYLAKSTDDPRKTHSIGTGEKIKKGLHIHFRHCIVNSERARRIRISVIDRVFRLAGGPFGPNQKMNRSFWEETIDENVYIGAGCRLVYSYKAEECPRKHAVARRQQASNQSSMEKGSIINVKDPAHDCDLCGGKRKVKVDRTYQGAYKLVNGKQIKDIDFVGNVHRQVILCSIRVPPNTALTDGFSAAGKPEIQSNYTIREYEAQYGEAAARKLTQTYGTSSETMQDYAAQTDSRHREMCAQNDVGYNASSFQVLFRDDDRYVFAKTLIEMYVSKIHPDFNGVEITHMKMQLPSARSTTSMPSLYAYTNSRLCMNKTNYINGSFGDDTRSLASHDNRASASLFFVLHLRSTGEAELVQCCFSRSNETNYRRSRKNCVDWTRTASNNRIILTDQSAINAAFFTRKEVEIQTNRSNLAISRAKRAHQTTDFGFRCEPVEKKRKVCGLP